MAYSGERLSFSSGELRRARIRMTDDGAGKSATSLAAERLARPHVGSSSDAVSVTSAFAATSLHL
jgi:hypothetical protein